MRLDDLDSSLESGFNSVFSSVNGISVIENSDFTKLLDSLRSFRDKLRTSLEGVISLDPSAESLFRTLDEQFQTTIDSEVNIRGQELFNLGRCFLSIKDMIVGRLKSINLEISISPEKEAVGA